MLMPIDKGSSQPSWERSLLTIRELRDSWLPEMQKITDSRNKARIQATYQTQKHWGKGGIKYVRRR